MIDNQNKKASVAFIIYYPFQFYVYKNVYKQLKEKAEFVIDLGVFFPIEQPAGFLPKIVSLLRSEGVYYRILNLSDYHNLDYIDIFFSNYKAVVSVWHWGCLGLYPVYSKKLVHMTYGAGKELTMFDLRKKDFDLILAYGEFDNDFYSRITDTEIIGNPKFDDWFNNRVAINSVSDVIKRFKKNSPTILYLPTHSDLSSIDELAETLISLGKNYNVVVKLHYYTPDEEPERVEKLTHQNIILCKDDVDLLPLLKVSDVILSDNSSAIFDAILADKPIIVTDFLDKDYLDKGHWNERTYRRGKAGPLTYSNSIEQKIKKDGIVDTIDSPYKLESSLAKILKKDEKKKIRTVLREKLFSYNDGRSGERGARAIEDLINGKRKKEKPFMYYALEYYKEKILQGKYRGSGKPLGVSRVTQQQFGGDGETKKNSYKNNIVRQLHMRIKSILYLKLKNLRARIDEEIKSFSDM